MVDWEFVQKEKNIDKEAIKLMRGCADLLRFHLQVHKDIKFNDEQCRKDVENKLRKYLRGGLFLSQIFDQFRVLFDYAVNAPSMVDAGYACIAVGIKSGSVMYCRAFYIKEGELFVHASSMDDWIDFDNSIPKINITQDWLEFS